MTYKRKKSQLCSARSAILLVFLTADLCLQNLWTWSPATYIERASNLRPIETGCTFSFGIELQFHYVTGHCGAACWPQGHEGEHNAALGSMWVKTTFQQRTTTELDTLSPNFWVLGKYTGLPTNCTAAKGGQLDETNSTVHASAHLWKVCRHLAGRETSSLLWNQKVHFSDHKSPPMGSILDELKPTHNFTAYFLKTIFNIIFSVMPRSQSCSLLPTKKTANSGVLRMRTTSSLPTLNHSCVRNA